MDFKDLKDSAFSQEVIPRNIASIILNERLRQIREEGYEPSQDTRYVDGELASAAACYALPPEKKGFFLGALWPWHPSAWRPAKDPSKVERMRELVKAGALIFAELERVAALPEDPR